VSRVAVVTGGSSGIGLGVARRFVAEGYRVALFDVNPTTPETAAAELEAEGTTVLAIEVDVADRPSVDAGVERVRSELGPVEILVTSAGIEAFTPVLDITAEQWDRIVAVNLTGTFVCVQAVLPDMLAAGWGASSPSRPRAPSPARPTWPITPPRRGASSD